MSTNEEIRFLYVTTKDRAQALAIGRALVERKLAACANVVDGMTSIYEWKGALEEASEAVLILKTTQRLVPAATAAVKELHTYEVPCVVSLPALGGNPDYLAWLRAGVR